MTGSRIAIGADIGGSHISTAAIDIENRTILKHSFAGADVNNKASKEEIIESWTSALLKTIKSIDHGSLVGIGFAMPGPFNYETGVAMFERVEKYEGLYGIDVGAAIRDVLNLGDSMPVRFMNDATSFAVGEAWMGKAAGYSRSLCLTLGTGFGSAFIEDGIPVVKGDSVPELGCVWHLPFKGGIADDFISTRWFINSYKELSGKEISGVKALAEVSGKDPFADQLFEQYGKNLGTILSFWLEKFRVEVLVIGGNISAAYPLFGPYFEKEIAGSSSHFKVEISELMEDAAIIGSARLVETNFWNNVKNLLKYM